ncbi:MAG: ATP-dependent RecD-like DNA helicase [Peptococcaceae bacterium]|nr:ATP-dependent RecD-like DNA helicase [Peptococcaceae bacterium]
MPEEAVQLTECIGVISKFIFQTPRFAIFRFRTPKEDMVALGEIFNAREGEKLFLRGSWEIHPKYGRQLKIKSWEKIVPTSRDEAIELLSSGLVKGVGPATAKKIVNVLGADAIEIILKNPEELKKVKGLGKRAEQIAQSIQETYDRQRIVKDLASFGLTIGMAQRAFKHFGRPVVDYIRINPYSLTKVDMIGFVKADEIAHNIGIAKDSHFRIQAGVMHVLNEALQNEGHTYLPAGELVNRSLAVLNKESPVVTEEKVREAFDHEDIEVHGKGVSLERAVRCEEAIARHVKRLNRKVASLEPAPVIRLYEKREGVELTEDQARAVAMVLNSGFSILTGGPGVGKTATIKAINAVARKIYPDIKIVFAAPTGRAARRISEVTGEMAHTIHKLLEFDHDGFPLYDARNPLPCDLIVVDEASMVDIYIARQLLGALKTGARVLFVGDVDQLPSVGPGNVLRDLLACPDIPRVTLDKVFRQAAKSQIIANAHRINKGQPLVIDNSKKDFIFLERESPEDICKTVVHWVKNLGCGPSEIQVLSPMKKGPAGTQELNRLIQESVNPSGEEIRLKNTLFRVGDKVIQTRNNYAKEVFNGDIGIITATDGDTIMVKFNGHEIEYAGDELKEIELAYAITVHKSQGSEFKNVIIPVTTSHYVMLARNLIYTGITRATERVVLVGTKKALAIAIRNNKPVLRYTMLREFL